MTTFGWDQGAIYSTSVFPANEPEQSLNKIESSFFNFIQQFRIDEQYIYRDQLRQNLMVGKYCLDVSLDHLRYYAEELADQVYSRPAALLPLFEAAVKRSAKKILYANLPDAEAEEKTPNCQVTLKSTENITPIRDLNAQYVSKLIRVAGIIIAASTPSAKATHVHLMCKGCRHVKALPVNGGFSGVQFPRICDAPAVPGVEKDCGMDPYIIIHDKCKFVDQQTLKLQEAPDMVPVGELPRHMVMSADRWLTNKVVPGTRVTVMGIYEVFSTKSDKSSAGVGSRVAYLRIVGLELDQDNAARGGRRTFTEEEEEEYIHMARQPNFYELFAHSIAPSIYGSSDVKKAIACLLLGGSRKILPDGMRLRGDINVLLLGDPGVAKSQLLKFVEKTAPIAVYTSGKGSSAAGLTASVIRDPSSREFYLEGGAMVLADGGVVCIDEFDKMREEDRVAIHEAMEQQTISIAKAGITTILNSRTSVLAAANPVWGRYDDMKTPGENIDFQSTILSRFDMIFILKDEHNDQRDMTIARHVMSIHTRGNAPEAADVPEIDIQKMKGFVAYAKSKCAPRLSPEAAEKLSSYFVDIRAQIRSLDSGRNAVPITIRQLEAVIRISEALAKLQLSPVATEQHVDEAIRLFKFSTMNAVKSGRVDGLNLTDLRHDVRKVEQEITKRLPLGSQIAVRSLKTELEKLNLSSQAIDRAIRILTDQGILQYRAQRMTVFRAAI
ncbi:MCM2/3/5 family-domain-containing protein [Paraphysoderma sedebokerense]|nr:MCM2/3/5 family-domain-containing protein [Paraphysoderma sedebokerense]